MTLLMGWNIPKIQLEPDIKALMPQDFEIIENMKDMEDTFGGNDLVGFRLLRIIFFLRQRWKKLRR
jgi:predicted RND superfamily exporter protein